MLKYHKCYFSFSLQNNLITFGHIQFAHNEKKGLVTIPYHGGNKDIPKWLAISILKQAGLK